MDITLNLAFTPADKRVWLWKFIATIAVVIVYGITYYFTGDTNAAAVAGAFATAVAVAFVATGVAAATAAAAAAVAATAAAAAAATVWGNEKHKISLSSNIISAILQFLLTWLGFYIAQHLQIYLSFAWV